LYNLSTCHWKGTYQKQSETGLQCISFVSRRKTRTHTMKSALLVLAALLGVVGLSYGQSSALPRALGSTPLPAAAFVEAYMDQGTDATPIGDRWTLYVSTFNPINGQPDPKYMLRKLGNELFNVNSWNLTDMGRTALWPNK